MLPNVVSRLYCRYTIDSVVLSYKFDTAALLCCCACTIVRCSVLLLVCSFNGPGRCENVFCIACSWKCGDNPRALDVCCLLSVWRVFDGVVDGLMGVSVVDRLTNEIDLI